MIFFLGILTGAGLPVQTSINTILTRKVASPYNASLISFVVALFFLSCLLLLTGQNLFIPFDKIWHEPFWIWMGGLCGVVFLTGNILVFPRIGSVQTVILPVFGQILMGLIIDNFGLFHSEQSPLTFFRILGAVFVATGIVIVSLAKGQRKTSSKNFIYKTDTKQKITALLWKIFAVSAGMLSATQTAINGYLANITVSPLKASLISFCTGIAVLMILCIILYLKNFSQQHSILQEKNQNQPWWIWTGGILGGIYILVNSYLSGIIGTGMTVILLLIGSTTGGLFIDHFGLFSSEKKPINIVKLGGIFSMLLGVAIIRLL